MNRLALSKARSKSSVGFTNFLQNVCSLSRAIPRQYRATLQAAWQFCKKSSVLLQSDLVEWLPSLLCPKLSRGSRKCRRTRKLEVHLPSLAGISVTVLLPILLETDVQLAAVVAVPAATVAFKVRRADAQNSQVYLTASKLLALSRSPSLRKRSGPFSSFSRLYQSWFTGSRRVQRAMPCLATPSPAVVV